MAYRLYSYTCTRSTRTGIKVSEHMIVQLPKDKSYVIKDSTFSFGMRFDKSKVNPNSLRLFLPFTRTLSTPPTLTQSMSFSKIKYIGKTEDMQSMSDFIENLQLIEELKK